MRVIENQISVMRVGKVDYISLTDIAKYDNQDHPADVVKNWLRNKDTIEFLGLWEKVNNPKFKLVEFDQFEKQAGRNRFVMSPGKWITATDAIGIESRSGNNGGTFAHPDIALEFANWVSVEFRLYLIKEFERLKQDESYRQKIVWSAHREIAKTNYLIHTQAIKDNIVPTLTEKQKHHVYADEADMLNVVLFGMTAGQWRKQNPKSLGNIRDYASDIQLKILINLENTNAQLIKDGKNQQARIVALSQIAREQMQIFTTSEGKKATSLAITSVKQKNKLWPV